jgi:D-aminopeptidase
VAKALTTKYKEARRIMGVVNAKAVMEIFMSPQGTWTVVVTDTNGVACIIAIGQDWQEVPIEMAELES